MTITSYSLIGFVALMLFYQAVYKAGTHSYSSESTRYGTIEGLSGVDR